MLSFDDCLLCECDCDSACDGVGSGVGLVSFLEVIFCGCQHETEARAL